jgi:hypothetical protein
MAVAIRVIGSPKRIDHGNDELMLKMAERITVGNKPLKLISLKLHNGVVRGGAVGNYKMRGFQTADVLVNAQTGAQDVKFTVDGNGKATSVHAIKFTPDGFGGRFAHIPDTEYNREKLILCHDMKFTILDEAVEKVIEKESAALKTRMNNAMEKAFESAKTVVHARHQIFIDGLKTKIGKGFEDLAEYKEVVGKEVKKLGRKYFAEDKSWKVKPTKQPAASK